MSLASTLYGHLPERVQPAVERFYHAVTDRLFYDRRHAAFVDEIFGSVEGYRRYGREFDEGPFCDIYADALDAREEPGGGDLSGVDRALCRDYYAVVRELEPSIVVETGVCNGVSTLALLLALEENGRGELYSIDYPFRADESLEDFRQQTFDRYAGAAIPSDEDPGWIVPDRLRDRWTLRIGKSQRELPRLVTELGSVDVFLHDSEHSHPCMMFEYELAYEWLVDGGLLLSDDISWNEAFSVFTRVREPRSWARLSRNVGYVVKGE